MKYLKLMCVLFSVCLLCSADIEKEAFEEVKISNKELNDLLVNSIISNVSPERQSSPRSMISHFSFNYLLQKNDTSFYSLTMHRNMNDVRPAKYKSYLMINKFFVFMNSGPNELFTATGKKLKFSVNTESNEDNVFDDTHFLTKHIDSLKMSVYLESFMKP